MTVRKSYLCVFIPLVLTCGAAADDEALKTLLAGVSEIAAPGAPGPLCVFGDRAFPVAVGGSGKNFSEPVVAAMEFGRGRAVAFGHTGYLDPDTLNKARTGRLLRNAIRWSAGDRRRDNKPRVGVYRNPKLLAYLQEKGVRAAALRGAGWLNRLRECDVLCCGSHSLMTEDIPAVRKFVDDGGGLVVAGLGWGWLQLNQGKTLDEHPGNLLLAPLGVVWADGYLKTTSEAGYAAKEPPPDVCHAGVAIDVLQASAAGKGARDANDIKQAVWIATRAMRSLPADDKLLRPKLRRLRQKRKSEIIPSAKSPVRMNKPLDRLLLTREIEELRKAPPDKVRAHAAADIFPGAVPRGAKKVTRSIEIDTNVPGWHGTGLYAAPGQQIVVKAAPTIAGQGLKVRIGAHKDKLWDKDVWKRCPEITRTFEIEKQATRAANAFGGLVYIEVPTGCELSEISLKISNAVAAPHFVFAETTLADWRDKIRGRPAPWAELESSKIIVTVPSETIRDLDDPAALMKVWDAIADACAELVGRPLERERPERYVADVQISAGYMHAGYPIMTHLDAAERMVDADHLKNEGAWGLFHELGHNHQSGDWTFGGTGEVTCNLFTLYVFEKVCGKYEESRPELFGKSRAETITNYLSAGADFEKWKSDAFLALLMYMQLKEAFGWDAYKKVFAEYRDLPSDSRPRSDAEKRDQWMVRFSHAVGKNLGPFFETWGVPTSEKARKSIADLPEWMPEGFPPTQEDD